MEYLGEINLLSNHFIIGCREVSLKFTKTPTEEIENLHMWIDFKDNDCGNEKYRTSRTQYIYYCNHIDLEQLLEIKIDLYRIYKKTNPNSDYSDFLNFIFKYTIYELTEFIERDFKCLGEPQPNTNNKYAYYTCYSREDSQFLDFAIPIEYSRIEYFKQYYKKVLELLKNPLEESKNKSPKNQRSFQYCELSQKHQHIIKGLLEKKFKESYIWNLMKYKSHQEIKERDFISFLNVNCGYEYPINKRLTIRNFNPTNALLEEYERLNNELQVTE
jgi:hypothetical protein